MRSVPSNNPDVRGFRQFHDSGLAPPLKIAPSRELPRLENMSTAVGTLISLRVAS